MAVLIRWCDEGKGRPLIILEERAAMSLIILDGAARVDANWVGMEGTRLGNEK